MHLKIHQKVFDHFHRRHEFFGRTKMRCYSKERIEPGARLVINDESFCYLTGKRMFTCHKKKEQRQNVLKDHISLQKQRYQNGVSKEINHLI